MTGKRPVAKQAVAVGVALLAAVAVLLVFTSISPAHPTTRITCQRGTIHAVAGGKAVCLKTGITCSRKFERVYTRLGFHCRNGRLQNRKVLLTIGGPDQVVYDSSQSGCGPGDWPDGDVVAFRDASGRVQVVLPSVHSNRRLMGPDLNHVTHDCTVTLDSNENSDPSLYDNGQWLAAVYPEGNTVYGLTHMEYVGARFPGMCPTFGFDSPDWIRCWWNTITLVVSTDGGTSYHRVPTRRGLVGALPYRYDPSGVGFEGMALNGITQIVRNPADGYFYTISGDVVAATPQTEGAGYQCLMRTRNLADPTSWRGWSGKGFTRTFVDPYREPTTPASAHRCQPLNNFPNSAVNLSLTWSTALNRWLGVFQNVAGGYWFTTSPDLTTWTKPQKFLDRPNPWGVKCGEPNEATYASVLDPSSKARNFTTTGSSPYFYFSQFDLSWPSCDRRVFGDIRLVRIPLSVRYSK